MERPTDDEIIRTCGHIHPTPAHIRDCATSAMFEAAQEWERMTGQSLPLMHMLNAMNYGVTLACREHLRGAK